MFSEKGAYCMFKKYRPGSAFASCTGRHGPKPVALGHLPAGQRMMLLHDSNACQIKLAMF